MGRSTRIVAAALAAVLVATSGCVTGHLLDVGRRREYVASVREAWVDGDRLVIGYDARVTDDNGRTLGRTPRWIVVPLAGVTTPATLRPEPLRSWDRSGRPVAVWDGTGTPPAPPFLRVTPAEDGDLLLAYEEPADPATLYASALTQVWTTPWVYLLVPFTLAFDLVTTPPLVAMAPAVLVMGE